MTVLPMYPMGSPDWVEHVFSTGPARNNKGHSKHTQYHQGLVPAMNTLMGTQGRPEACALLVIQYLFTLGLVKRFKAQPFQTIEEEFEAEIFPDFLVELPDGRLLVIEIKTERFITHALKQLFDRNHERFKAFGMTYLVWSDKLPLNHATRHHAIQMRRFSGDDIPRTEIDGLAAFVAERRAVTLSEMYEAGFDLGCLYASAWEGKLFAPLCEEFSPRTKVTPWRQEDFEAIFLDCKRSSNEWWDSL